MLCRLCLRGGRGHGRGGLRRDTSGRGGRGWRRDRDHGSREGGQRQRRRRQRGRAKNERRKAWRAAKAKTDRRRREDDEGDGPHAGLIYISTRFRGLQEARGWRSPSTTTRASPDHPGLPLPPSGSGPDSTFLLSMAVRLPYPAIPLPCPRPDAVPALSAVGAARFSALSHNLSLPSSTQPRIPPLNTQTLLVIPPAYPPRSQQNRPRHTSRSVCTVS